jgi:hypothetical protein
MLQVIKLILIDTLEVVEEKVQSFMKFQNKDVEDENSIPNRVNACDFFEVEMSENSSLVVNCKGECSLYFELLNKSGVKYTTEDVTTLYFKNQLRSFVPEVDVDRFNQFLVESLSVDDVLDKISESGIDSLNDVDKMVLQRA